MSKKEIKQEGRTILRRGPFSEFIDADDLKVSIRRSAVVSVDDGDGITFITDKAETRWELPYPYEQVMAHLIHCGETKEQVR